MSPMYALLFFGFQVADVQCQTDETRTQVSKCEQMSRLKIKLTWKTKQWYRKLWILKVFDDIH